MKNKNAHIFQVLWIPVLIMILMVGCAESIEAKPFIQEEKASEHAAEITPEAQAIISITLAPVEKDPMGFSTLPSAPTPIATPTAIPTKEPIPETPSPEPKPLDGVVIGIDPGHQLIYNPAPEPVAPNSYETKQKVAGGCRGVKSGVYEYEVVLNVGLYLRDMLIEQGATVIMTHEILDVDISNIERAEIFNQANVDLGIRLHCNNADNPSTRGAFMLVPTEKRTDFYEFNVRAAQVILDAYLAETGLSMRYKGGLTYRGDQTGFNWSTRPVITIEMGHLSCPAEDALLSDPEFQQKMALGLCNGIVRVFTEP